MKIVLTRSESIQLLQRMKECAVDKEDLQYLQNKLEACGAEELITENFVETGVPFEEYFDGISFYGIDIEDKEFKFI